jgi:tetratricopeptide (TPR) repeat protein
MIDKHEADCGDGQSLARRSRLGLPCRAPELNPDGGGSFMTIEVINLNCPGCGAPAAISSKSCEYCDRPVVIRTFQSVAEMSLPEVSKYAGSYRKALAKHPENHELNNSLGMCYLKLRLYDRAIAAFDKAIVDNFDNSETFFYAAVCLLKGKKAFLHQRPEIDRMLEYINAALMIEPKGIYYYLLAYIKYDYFERKFFKTSPTWREALAMAEDTGLSVADVERLYELLGVERPGCL